MTPGKFLEFFFVVIPLLLFWLVSGWLEKDWEKSLKTIKEVNKRPVEK